jgi:ribosomal 30S subunit maturation factor RimM
MAYHYAIAHHRTADARDEDGNYVGTVHRFMTHEARDVWINESPNRTALLPTLISRDHHAVVESFRTQTVHGEA